MDDDQEVRQVKQDPCPSLAVTNRSTASRGEETRGLGLYLRTVISANWPYFHVITVTSKFCIVVADSRAITAQM